MQSYKLLLLTAFMSVSAFVFVVQAKQVDWSDEILYFVLVDRFADGKANIHRKYAQPKRPGYFHGGDLVGLTQHIDEIADIGVTAIWLNPLVKNIDTYVGMSFPDWGYHGYWADDFKQIDARFGTETEFKAFVDAAHERDMKVLLDIVYNHPGYGSRYENEPQYAGWLRSNCSQDGADPLTQCLAGLPDFDTDNPKYVNTCLMPILVWQNALAWMGFV